MILQNNRLLALRILLLSVILACFSISNDGVANGQLQTATSDAPDKRYCLPNDETIRAKRKKCLLRPDSGPCRADILAYYYDAKKKKCYRFFYGGCQGNGNNFNSRKECLDQCLLVVGSESFHIPYFCSLPFDFGNCFGQYNRWAWDKQSGHCKLRLYSGCGGNQNNFATKQECMLNCLMKPNNTLTDARARMTTCIPITIPDFN